MALKNYGADGANLTVFGIPVENFGDTDPAITIEDIEQRSTLKRGLGGTSLRMENVTVPKRVTINLLPAAPAVNQILAAARSGVDASFKFTQSNTNERHAGFDGVLINRGQVGRAGKTTVSDEQLIFEFADSEET